MCAALCYVFRFEIFFLEQSSCVVFVSNHHVLCSCTTSNLYLSFTDLRSAGSGLDDQNYPFLLADMPDMTSEDMSEDMSKTCRTCQRHVSDMSKGVKKFKSLFK